MSRKVAYVQAPLTAIRHACAHRATGRVHPCSGPRPVLSRVADGTAIVACNTCRHSAELRDAPDGTRGGEGLILAMRAVQQRDPRYADIAVQEMSCLFACQDFCTVHLRAPGKIGYVLGKFAPDEDAARAILDYAVEYAASEHGRVAYSKWPEGVKGHFITRTPPAGFVCE
jgi:predicted metal-binding protein